MARTWKLTSKAPPSFSVAAKVQFIKIEVGLEQISDWSGNQVLWQKREDSSQNRRIKVSKSLGGKYS